MKTSNSNSQHINSESNSSLMWLKIKDYQHSTVKQGKQHDTLDWLKINQYACNPAIAKSLDTNKINQSLESFYASIELYVSVIKSAHLMHFSFHNVKRIVALKSPE